ncbi:MAG: hypothetical protein UY57_C0041G0005 [Candidatus Kaiserbacteria bacterium GW2011_GWB1_50_17]|uniref:DUF2269 domain-containing protein n=3 Tax=Candidatus Kaiseribacteriota TaxID=1752734 RepID=A0A0G1WC09_9BACT|nr:MAG: hypothetical protein UY57_C0041G0005 [Candidatus Kaiserbacteria bacterium GW2011_GWB1_50_17]OGG86434.1 MAG: hypothetical protein A3H15_03085 [Candidatus Kaiserbacteria bacterium RIFCSPLOWO2_12_FULL_50_28]HCM43894.1 hypothetical protein [Candidatus Kaiserbacteria bacterium]
MDWYTFLIITHIIGTVLGVGGATFAEVHLIRALRDGTMSRDENSIMQATYAILRVGFFLLILSGFGFFVLARLEEHTGLLYSIKLWAKLGIVGIIGVNAVLLQLRWIPLLWGSAIAFTSWYAALILGALGRGEYSFFWIYAVYIAAIIIVYFVLRAIHARYIPHKH